MGQAGAGNHSGQVDNKTRRNGQSSRESHRVTNTKPGGPPPKSTATTLTEFTKRAIAAQVVAGGQGARWLPSGGFCAGALAFDAGQQPIAQACFTDALALARQAGNPEVETVALTGLARQSYVLGRPREAQRLATAAEHVATSPGGSPRLAVIPHLRQAVASSLMADAPETDRAITQARKALDRDHDKPVEKWSVRTPIEIDGIEATCALELGQASRAEALLEQVVVTYESSRFRRNCALYRVRLVRARRDSRAVDGAAEAANVVIDDLAGELSSWRVSSELDAVARRLADYPDVPGVDRFLARRSAMSA